MDKCFYSQLISSSGLGKRDPAVEANCLARFEVLVVLFSYEVHQATFFLETNAALV